MNIETANKLYELRKKNNYSQEEVALKLGISRQSVSKWERAEASPDTDNLIMLAKLYNVSLDELLNIEKSQEFNDENPNNEETEDEVVFLNDNEDKKIEIVHHSKISILVGIISGSIALIVTGIYLILGFTVTDSWANFWPLFFLIVIIPTLEEAIRKKRFSEFAYPILITMIYCFLGMFLDLWHPMWVLFITIPIYYIAADKIDRAIKR